MSQRGSTARVPATLHEVPPEVCPRCETRVMALGVRIVCRDLACDWSRPRFDAPATPPPPAAAARARAKWKGYSVIRREREQAKIVRLLAAAGPLTLVEIARRTRLGEDRARQLVGYLRLAKIGRGHAKQYALEAAC
jgi:hypothetical protein